MRASASLENALRRLEALRRTAARVRTHDLAIVFGRVAAVLFCLQLEYLAIGNALLRTRAIQNAVEAATGFHLQFGRAYTLWLGHVRVHDFRLRFEDYNVQFELTLPQADIDISLSELLFKKFHATRVVAEGARFRMRHKLIAVGNDAERVAAYPPIAGFADPPYYAGVRSPPISDAEYDLWQVRVENVYARVSELWAMEYRFRGHGVAQGSLVVKPMRWVQVEPASLVLTDGTLTLAEHRVAEHFRGRVTCDVPDLRVQETEGRQVFERISSTISLELSGGKLDFLQAYLARLGSARYAGNASWRFELNVAHGIVEPGSRVELWAKPFELRHHFATLSGDVTATFGRNADQAPEQLLLAVEAPRIVARRAGGAASPSIEGSVGSLRLNAVDLSADMSLGAAKLQIRRAQAPSLAWFPLEGSQLSGAAEATLALERSENRSVFGQARLQATRAEFRHGDFAAAADLRSELAFFRGAGASRVGLPKLTLELADARLVNGDKSSAPFGMSVDGSGLRVTPPADVSASGNLRIRISSAEALLPLVLGKPLREIANAALDLKALEARASVEFSRTNVNVNVIDARSGNVRLRGFLSKRTKQPRGAFLVSSGPINVGITLSGGSTEVSPFVGDDWLATAWPRVSQAPGAG